MAGLGKRFSDESFDKPKPLLAININEEKWQVITNVCESDFGFGYLIKL